MNLQQKKIRVALINDTRPTHHYGCMLVMDNLIRILNQLNAEVVWTWPVGIDWRKHKSKLRNQSNVDAIIVNGEGTIHHSADRKHARALVEFAEFARDELKTDSYLVNATLYKNESSVYKKLAIYKAIYVRDKGSLQELQENGLKGHYVPDLTFAKAGIYDRNPVKKGCVIDTALKSEIPKMQAFCAQNGFDFRSMVVARPSNANFFKSPRPFIKNVIKWWQTDRYTSIDPRDFITYLNQYELVVTGRYHTVTMCLKNKIPFVSIESNTPKISFLLEDAVGSTDRVISFSDLENIDLNAFSSYSEKELLLLEQFINKAENEIYEMLNVIVSEVSRNKEF